jgi:hypothetical protein
MYHNPELYEHLKEATKEASGLLKDLVNKLQAVPTKKTYTLPAVNPTQGKVNRKRREEIKTELSGIVNEIIPNQPSFKSCVEFQTKDVDINEIIEELAMELFRNSTNKDVEKDEEDVEKDEEGVEMNEEGVRKWLQKFANENVEINEDLKEDVRQNVQSLIKSKVNIKAVDKAWSRIGEYLNCLGFTNWNNFREFNEQTFDEYYAEYEQFIYSNLPVKYQIVASLENFNYAIPSSDIILSSNTRIVSNREKHIAGYLSSTPTYDIGEDEDEIEDATEQLHYKSQFLSDFWLEIDCEIEKAKIPSECKEYIEHTSLEEVRKVFKILRLYKEGDFKDGVIYWRPKNKMPFDSPYTKKFNFCVFERYDTSNKYLLKMDDINKLQLLFQKYSNNSKMKKFPNSAINYLDKGVVETDTPHRLVDYVAALESFLVEGKEGIATMLALRTAFFLEGDRQKCREMFRDIKKAYSLRSNIVHGDYHKIKDKLELEKYCKKTEKYVRLAIIKWIDMIGKGKTEKEIYESIEDKLFSL